jgi:PBSX family phage terminase large subunit
MMFPVRQQQEEITVPLTDCIGQAFYDMHWDIVDGNHTYYDCVGGRGSLKSSVISLEIILGMMEDKDANALVYRKVADTIGDSVYEQICWAIDKLGVTELWHCTKSPYRCTYKPTGQKIVFKGLDKAKKSKSVKTQFGYFKYLWFEELDEFNGEQELRTVQQSVLRGGPKFVVFRSMNPPRSKTNWANSFIEQDKLRSDVYVSETTYLQAPKEWLGQQFIDDAEWLKEINPKAYEHEYLGKAVGTGNNVFDNIVGREITDEEIASFDHIHMGIDWGWYPDPFHWGKMHYDANRRKLYIFDEYRTIKTKNRDTAAYLVEHKGVRAHDQITCDSAEKKSTADYRSYGLNARDAEKGPDSVRYGLKWLQSLVEIVIDPKRCPATYKEFKEYEYELTKDGEPTSNVPDANNHSIDMTRYAMEKVWKRKGR